MNINGAANGYLGPASYGVVFKTFHVFVKGCFQVPVGVAYAFKVEILVVFYVLEIVSNYFGRIFGSNAT